jgi:hypothetical protein
MVCKVLDRLQEMDMYLKPSKCYFEVHKIEFLGMILENGTVTMDPVKVAGVAEWKEPKNVKDIRKFLDSATSVAASYGDSRKSPNPSTTF